MRFYSGDPPLEFPPPGRSHMGGADFSQAAPAPCPPRHCIPSEFGLRSSPDLGSRSIWAPAIGPSRTPADGIRTDTNRCYLACCLKEWPQRFRSDACSSASNSPLSLESSADPSSVVASQGVGQCTTIDGATNHAAPDACHPKSLRRGWPRVHPLRRSPGKSALGIFPVARTGPGCCRMMRHNRTAAEQ